ncbi:hypothetical protein Nepgr_009456 [Nepenthes gracilis]|uniref:Uncharacterized protein n=1 Tax=Nepenthes gracilis TaxID=150966 RepID=A0AAD3SAX1_NEPGR|nr:hypothetical protein Nepgr_009456 [Nepenthes gracilis]
MDEQEFQRLLNLFPVVRSRNYHADSESSSLATSLPAKDEVKEWQNAWDEGDKKAETQDAFWGKLRSAAERKVGAAEAEKFCDAFRHVYRKLVYEEISKEAVESFLNLSVLRVSTGGTGLQA